MIMKGGYKTTLCKNYMEGGNCNYGAKCTFAHGPMELRCMENAAGGGPPMHAPPANPMAMANPRYKTSMCNSMVNEGQCQRGALCHFAHSPQEMRIPQQQQ